MIQFCDKISSFSLRHPSQTFKSRVADSCVYYLEETHFRYLHLAAFYHALRPQTAFSFLLLLKSYPHGKQFVTFRSFIIKKKEKKNQCRSNKTNILMLDFLVFVTFKAPRNCYFSQQTLLPTSTVLQHPTF